MNLISVRFYRNRNVFEKTKRSLLHAAFVHYIAEIDYFCNELCVFTNKERSRLFWLETKLFCFLDREELYSSSVAYKKSEKQW